MNTADGHIEKLIQLAAQFVTIVHSQRPQQHNAGTITRRRDRKKQGIVTVRRHPAHRQGSHRARSISYTIIAYKWGESSLTGTPFLENHDPPKELAVRDGSQRVIKYQTGHKYNKIRSLGNTTACLLYVEASSSFVIDVPSYAAYRL